MICWFSGPPRQRQIIQWKCRNSRHLKILYTDSLWQVTAATCVCVCVTKVQSHCFVTGTLLTDTLEAGCYSQEVLLLFLVLGRLLMVSSSWSLSQSLWNHQKTSVAKQLCSCLCVDSNGRFLGVPHKMRIILLLFLKSGSKNTSGFWKIPFLWLHSQFMFCLWGLIDSIRCCNLMGIKTSQVLKSQTMTCYFGSL